MRRAVAHIRRVMRSGLGDATLLVRVAASHAEAAKLLYFAQDAARTQEAIAQVEKCILEDHGVELSTFEVETVDRFSAGHALGVIAATINQSAYSATKRNEYDAKLERAIADGDTKVTDDVVTRKEATFIVRFSDMNGCVATFTPLNNLEFTPADDRHFDVQVTDRAAFAKAFVDALRRGRMVHSFLDKKDVRAVAVLALADCVRRLRAGARLPWTTWFPGASLDAREQEARLRYVAGDRGFVARPHRPK